MVQNQRAIENAEIYTYGDWTSQSLDPDLFRLDAVDAVWGKISWNEEFTVDKGDGSGYVRVDILRASDDVVLEADFAYNANGIDLSTYSSIGSETIKVRVKLYGLNDPTPRVSKLLIRSKYGGDYGMLNSNGLMTFLERPVKSTPTRTAISAFDIGTGGSEPGGALKTVSESDTALFTQVFGANLNAESTFTEDTTNHTLKIRGEVGTGDANGSALNEAGLKNTDAVPLCSHEVWTPAISKNNSTTVSLIWTFQVENKI
jgi:hypothetical protein